MPTLAENIEALRLKLLEAAEEEQFLVDSLGQRIAEADAKLVRALRQIIADQERQRQDIAGMLATLSARVGHLPRAETPPPLPQPPAGYTTCSEALLRSPMVAGRPGVH